MALQPVALSAALLKDDVGALSAAIQEQGLLLASFYDWEHPKQGLQRRDLLSMAASASAASCVAALLAAGANCNAQSPSDGNTALHCACSAASSSTARIIALLVRGGADKLLRNHAGLSACELLTQETSQVASQDPEAAEDSDLLKPEYSTDDFRMFSFKIDCCPRLAESHDWTLCPFQHPGEKARRRDPRCYRYQGVPCPDFRKGTCKRGDACTYAHGVFECWLHPSRYRTQLCKEGAACRRSVCFFAHSVEQLREPTKEPEAGEPESPCGPLVSAEESQDTPRSWSPTPPSSEGSIRLLGSTAEPLPRAFMHPSAPGSIDSMSSISSMSSTPVLDGSLAAADSLQRTLSSLSLASDDMSQVVALQQVANGMPAHAALLAATAAAHWPMQVPSPDALALLASSASPLGASSLQGMLLQETVAAQAAAVQAAAVQRQLAMLQAASPSGLLAATTMRQPLHPLSVNLGQLPHAPSTPIASCFGLRM